MSAAFDAKLREEGLQRAARLRSYPLRSGGVAAMKPHAKREPASRARPHLRERVAALEAEVSRLRLLMEDVTR